MLWLAACGATTYVEPRSSGADSGADAGGTSGGSDSGAAPSNQQLAQAFNEAARARKLRCGQEFPFGFLTEVLGSSYTFPLLPELFDAPGVGAALRASIESCSGVLGSAPCGGLPPACIEAQATPGTLATDSPCQNRMQCASGACTGTRISCGVCKRSMSVGQACAQSSECALGLVCAGSSPGLCTVVQWGGDGASCDGNALECGPGFACTPQSGGGSLCRPLAALGEACKTDAHGECDNRGQARCVSNVCVSLETASAGTSCAYSDECASGLLCDGVTEKCREARDVPQDAECTYGDRCASGTHCEFSGSGKRLCLADYANGQPCGSAGGGGACTPTSACDHASTKVCKPRLYPADCK